MPETIKKHAPATLIISSFAIVVTIALALFAQVQAYGGLVRQVNDNQKALEQHLQDSKEAMEDFHRVVVDLATIKNDIGYINGNIADIKQIIGMRNHIGKFPK